MASPDGKWEALIQNFNVAIRENGRKDALPFTFDGTEGDHYVLSSAAWSPDSHKIAVYRVRNGQHRKIAYIESSPADQVQPKFWTAEYAKPGDVLDLPRPVLIDVPSRKAMPITSTLFENPYSMSGFD